MLNINDRVVANLHHSTGKFKSSYGLFKVLWLRINIRYHNGVTVTANGILQEISQFTLSIRNVLPLVITDWNYNLLEESKWFVNISCFFKVYTLSSWLLSSFRASQINKVKLWINNFLRGFVSTFALQVYCVNAMTSTGLLVKLVSTNSSFCLTLKQEVKSLFFIHYLV